MNVTDSRGSRSSKRREGPPATPRSRAPWSPRRRRLLRRNGPRRSWTADAPVRRPRQGERRGITATVLLAESRKIGAHAAWKPAASRLVAAINGPALGIGIEICLAATAASPPKSESPPRPPRDPARPLSRSRRHPPHRPHDGAGRAPPLLLEGNQLPPARAKPCSSSMQSSRPTISSTPPRTGPRPTPNAKRRGMPMATSSRAGRSIELRIMTYPAANAIYRAT